MKPIKLRQLHLNRTDIMALDYDSEIDFQDGAECWLVDGTVVVNDYRGKSETVLVPLGSVVSMVPMERVWVLDPEQPLELIRAEPEPEKPVVKRRRGLTSKVSA